MNDLLFTKEDTHSDEAKKIEFMLSVYQTVQAIILYSEEVDITSASNLQVNKEMRDALDHIMRIYNHKLNSIEVDNRLIIENYEKAVGHLYRAAFDALDGTVMSLTELISEGLNRFHVDALREVLPNYWDKKKEIYRIKNSISGHRAQKDVGAKSDETLNAYIKDVNTLDIIYTEILERGPQIDECARILLEQEKKRKNRDIVLRVAFLLAGALIAALVGYFSR